MESVQAAPAWADVRKMRMSMMKIFKVLGKRGRITIPFEIRRRVGFDCNDILSFEESEDGQAVLVRREKVCDECRIKRGSPGDTAELLGYLDGLTAEEQRAALVHLSVIWAEKQ